MPQLPKWTQCFLLKSYFQCCCFLSLSKDWHIVGKAYFLTLTVSIRMSWSWPAPTTQSTFPMVCLLLSVRCQIAYSLLCPIYSSWDHDGTGSHKGQLKALNTCVSHIWTVLIIFYVPVIALTSMHHFGQHTSSLAMILFADIFLLVPPLMNPIV